MQIHDTQIHDTTETQAIAPSDTRVWDATRPRLVTDVSWPPSDADLHYVATLEDGEVLDVPDAQVAALVAYAWKTGQRVVVATDEMTLVNARLDSTGQAAPTASTLTTFLDLSVITDDIARALFRAAAIQAHQGTRRLSFDAVAPDVRATFRQAATVAIRKLDAWPRALAVLAVREALGDVPVEAVVVQFDQALARQETR